MFSFCPKGIAIAKEIAYDVNTNICSFCGGEMMGIITIILGVGFCGFLIWFFEAILKDMWAGEDSESEVVYLRRKPLREDSSKERAADLYMCSSADEIIVTKHSNVA